MLADEPDQPAPDPAPRRVQRFSRRGGWWKCRGCRARLEPGSGGGGVMVHEAGCTEGATSLDSQSAGPVTLAAYEYLGPASMHRHGTSEPGWVQHDHLGGGAPHGHDPETGSQVPVCPRCGTAGCLEDKALDW